MNFPIRLVDTICNSANPYVWVFQWKLLSSSWAELSSRPAGLPCNAVQGSSNFWVRGWNPKVWLFKWKLLNRTFQSYCWFTMQYKVVLTFEFVDKIQKMSVTVQVKATEQNFPVVLPVYHSVQGGSNFWVCGWNPKVWLFKWNLLSSTFLRYRLLCCTRWLKLLSLWMKS